MDQIKTEKLMESSSFSNLYKYNNKNKELSQQQRREKFLEDIKCRRREIIDQNRKLCEEFINTLDTLTDKMECDELKTTEKKSFKFELMSSEWFTEIPDDLEDNWIVKFCPQGCRVLFTARGNQTHISINGRIILNIKTNFPGGGGGGKDRHGGTTVLDCIFNKCTKTIFILDCLFWNGMSVLDSEADFRFFWLKTKFEETPELAKYKKYTFVLLDSLPAVRSLIQDKMFTTLTVGEYRYAFDGVVFYHKQSHYTLGYTPLVTWLASYMLPEKLHIDVSSEHMFRKPKDYVCMEVYLENLAKRKKLKRSKSNTVTEMEVQ